MQLLRVSKVGDPNTGMLIRSSSKYSHNESAIASASADRVIPICAVST
jgi:hypothetical protein